MNYNDWFSGDTVVKLEKGLLDFIKKYRYWLGASIIICITSAYLYLHNTISKYQVDCVVEIEKNDKSQITETELNTEIKKIKSRDLILQAVREDALKNNANGTLGFSVDSLATVYSNSLDVTAGSEPNTLTISIVDINAKRGQAFLKDLVSRYKYSYLSIDQNKLNHARLINDSLNVLNAALYEVKRKPSNIGKGEEAPHFANQKQVIGKGELKREAKAMQIVLSYAERGTNSFVLIPDSYIPQKNILSQLILQFNSLQMKKQSVISNNLSDTEITKATQNLLNISGQIKSEIGLQTVVISKQLNPPAKINYASYNKQGGIKAQSAEEGKIKSLIVELKKRSSGLLAGHYLPTQTIAITDYNITPVQPEAPIIYLSAVLLGLVLPSSIIYGWQKMHKLIRNAADIESVSDIEIAGEMPDETEDLKSTASTDKTNTSTFSRAITSIASSILVRLAEGQKVIAVTSASEGEGKAHFILKFAEAISATNKVLVLDYDFESPKILEKIELPYTIGLSNYLVHDDAHLSRLVTPSVNNKNLSFIGAASTGKDIRDKMKNFFTRIAELPDEEHLGLLYQQEANERFKKLLTELKMQFDYVLLYIPNLVQLPNFKFLGQLIDANVYMVRYHYTSKEQLAIFEQLAKEKLLKSALIVGNDLHHSSEKLVL